MDDLRQASADVSGVQILSPAARDVLQAFDYTRDGEYIAGEWVVNERVMLAAALRAAANYCPRERRILMTIADELEGQGQLTKESDYDR